MGKENIGNEAKHMDKTIVRNKVRIGILIGSISIMTLMVITKVIGFIIVFEIERLRAGGHFIESYVELIFIAASTLLMVCAIVAFPACKNIIISKVVKVFLMLVACEFPVYLVAFGINGRFGDAAAYLLSGNIYVSFFINLICIVMLVYCCVKYVRRKMYLYSCNYSYPVKR